MFLVENVYSKYLLCTSVGCEKVKVTMNNDK